MNSIGRNKGVAWLLGGTLAAAIALPLHAAGYTQTNLIASTDAYGASIVDPSLINAWSIAIHPAGLGGHFWVESMVSIQHNSFCIIPRNNRIISIWQRSVAIPIIQFLHTEPLCL